MTRAFAGLVVAALVAVTIAFPSHSRAAAWIDTGLDLDPTGNEAQHLGSIESCRSVDSGDTFEVDVWVRGIPAPNAQGTDGLKGTSYNLHFDPEILRATAVKFEGLMIATGDFISFEWIDGDGTDGAATKTGLPATTGNLRAEYADLSQITESGDGVLSRITLEAIGTGTTDLTLTDDQYDNYPAPSVLEGGGNLHFINTNANGVVVVGGECEPPIVPTPIDVGSLDIEHPQGLEPPGPPPGPGGVPSGSGGTPGTSGSATPGATGGTSDDTVKFTEGETAVAVDVIPSENEATVIGEVETCAAANVGDTFAIDIVINDVEDLIAFEASVAFDGSILDIVDRDTKLFLESTAGSQVVDTSKQTPDDSGQYKAGGVDTADPLSPETGSGVLARLTLEAKADGTSDISLASTDVNSDGKDDLGLFLRNVDGDIIGDEDDDTFFDGPVADATIIVGDSCEDADAKVVKASGSEQPGEGGDGTDALPFVVAGAVASGLFAAAGAGYLAYRRRKEAGSASGAPSGDASPPGEPPFS